MEMHQLRYLLAVAEEGSFTRAAERLLVAQSGVSAQVAKLEQELGVPLLERLPRGVRPTGAGTEVLVAARAVLDAADTVAETARQHTGLLRGEVRLGTLRGGVMTSVVDPVAAFRAAHPAVVVRLVEGDSDDLLDDVRAGRLDLALVGWSGTAPAGVETVLLGDDVLVAVMPPSSRATGGRLSLRTLAAHPLLTLPRGTGARTALDAAAAAADLRLEPTIESSEPGTLVALVRRGLGVAVMSSRTAAAHAPGLPVRRLATSVTSSLGLAVRPAPSPAARALAQGLLRAAGA